MYQRVDVSTRTEEYPMAHRDPQRFGVLVTPGTEATAFARLAEELGYDLIAVPDTGPELDAWTLLGWIAGRTERIGLLAAGLDLTDREPAVLARAAASLDLLS